MLVASLREKVVTEAQTWIGTPWHNNQCLKGVGCDCVNLPYAVYQELEFDLPELVNYNRSPTGEKLLNILDTYANLLGVVKDRYPWSDRYSYAEMSHEDLLSVIDYGDIMVYSRDFGGPPGHLAIRSYYGKIDALFRGGVTETGLGNEFKLLAGYSVIGNSS